ncbi:hypothetical protein JCM18909_3606 [Cutibacterium acnes JCM 18909]|nr:hypothetical protein JCM18909_3606 [Cutibacterium acnes JCM 18909]
MRDHTVGRMRAVTVMPVSIGPAASRTLRWQVALAEISSMGSRRVRNCVGLERLVTSMTWACTQMAPQRSTHFDGVDDPRQGARIVGGVRLDHGHYAS